jgi:hypothetical protein
MVERAFTAMPRSASATLISRNVIPAFAEVIARRSSAWASSSGRRWPPILAGAVLPVRRTRCISLTAADGLTSNRKTACRIDAPPSTARTIRSRRSRDNGAVMVSSNALTPSTLESDLPIPFNPEPL